MKKFILGVCIISTFSASAQTISDTGALRTFINGYIVRNGNRTITAQQLNAIFNAYLNFWPSGGGGQTATLADGAYLPVVTNVFNAVSIVADSATYSRNGNTVYVDGAIELVAGTANFNIALMLSLPISSPLPAGAPCWGSGTTSEVTGNIGQSVVISASAPGSNLVSLTVFAVNLTTNFRVFYHFSYRVE